MSSHICLGLSRHQKHMVKMYMNLLAGKKWLTGINLG